jgi:DNA-directed RNA polymerase beta subunit
VKDLFSIPPVTPPSTPVVPAPASALPAPVPAIPAPQYREFDDINTARGNIDSGVLDAIQKKYTGVENDRYRLALENVRYEDQTKTYTLEDQKKALMQRASLSKRIRGNWKLTDKATGEVVDQRDEIVAHVPHMTDRGTFIYNGNEYTVASQARLRPGVYTRRKDNGGYEAHFNVLPGTGRAFRIHMDPESGIFKMQLGQSHIPMYPLMRALGVTDKQLENTWGRDLLVANRSKDDPKALEKAYKRLLPRGTADNAADQAKEIQAEFDRIRMEPDVVERSLGKYLQEEGTTL